VGLLAILNFMRIALVDSHLKPGICEKPSEEESGYHAFPSSSSSSSEGHSEDESFKTGCVDYVLPYAIFGVMALLVFILAIYFASSIYYDRVIYHILKWDRIAVENKIGKQAYKDFLVNSKIHELMYKELTQQSLLEFTGTLTGAQKRASTMPVAAANESSSQQAHSAELRRASNLETGGKGLVRPGLVRQGSVLIKRESAYVDLKSKRKESFIKGQAKRASVYGLTDMYDRGNDDIMTIDEYKLEIDYMKAKAEHEEEILLASPWHERWHHQMHEMFNIEIKSFLPKTAVSKARKALSETPVQEIEMKTVEHDVESYGDYPLGIEPTQKEKIISDLFLFRSPTFHFAMVNISLLFECFYISIWATQLIPLSFHSSNKAFYVIMLTFPMLLTGYLFESILHQTVMLQCVEGLHTEVVDIVCDECIQEAKVLLNIRRAIREKCVQQSSDQSKWHTIIRDQFNKFDVDGNGKMDSKEFRHFLGTLDIYMSKARFDIAWEAIDFDLSGAITWDELFILVFPEYQYDIREEVRLFDDLRDQMMAKLQMDNIPKHKWAKYLYSLFQQVDEDKSSFIEKDELARLLFLLDFKEYSESDMHMLFHAMDSDCDDKISFVDLCRVLHLNVKSDEDLTSRDSGFNLESTLYRLTESLRWNPINLLSRESDVARSKPTEDAVYNPAVNETHDDENITRESYSGGFKNV
jgi:Ca2+-binding EF-hand superfamily protein